MDYKGRRSGWEYRIIKRSIGLYNVFRLGVSDYTMCSGWEHRIIKCAVQGHKGWQKMLAMSVYE
jgi:hypothetical protein